MTNNSDLKPISCKKRDKITKFITKFSDCYEHEICDWKGNMVIINGYKNAKYVIYQIAGCDHWTFEYSNGFTNRPTLKELLVEAVIHINRDKTERIYNKNYYFDSDTKFMEEIEWSLDK